MGNGQTSLLLNCVGLYFSYNLSESDKGLAICYSTLFLTTMEIKNDTAYQIHFGTNSDSEFCDSSDSEECYKPPPIDYDPSSIIKIYDTFSQDHNKFVSSLDQKSDRCVENSPGKIINDVKSVHIQDNPKNKNSPGKTINDVNSLLIQDNPKNDAKQITLSKRTNLEKPIILEKNNNEDCINNGDKKSVTINNVRQIESLVCMKHFGISSAVLSQKYYTQEDTMTNAALITIHKVPKWKKSMSFMNKTYMNAISIDEFHRILKDKQKMIFLDIDSLEFSPSVRTEPEMSYQIPVPSNNIVFERQHNSVQQTNVSTMSKPISKDPFKISHIDNVLKQSSKDIKKPVNELKSVDLDNKYLEGNHSIATHVAFTESKLMVPFNLDSNQSSVSNLEVKPLIKSHKHDQILTNVGNVSEKLLVSNQVLPKKAEAINELLLVNVRLQSFIGKLFNTTEFSTSNSDANKPLEQTFEDASLLKHQTDSEICGDSHKQTEKSSKSNQVSKKTKATNNPKRKKRLVSSGIDAVANFDQNPSLYYENILKEFTTTEREISPSNDCDTNSIVSNLITDILNGVQNATASSLGNNNYEEATSSQNQSGLNINAAEPEEPTKCSFLKTIFYILFPKKNVTK